MNGFDNESVDSLESIDGTSEVPTNNDVDSLVEVAILVSLQKRYENVGGTTPRVSWVLVIQKVWVTKSIGNQTPILT